MNTKMIQELGKRMDSRNKNLQVFFFYQEYNQFSSVQSLSCVQLFATPWTAARQASLSITNSCSLLKLMSIEFGDYKDMFSDIQEWKNKPKPTKFHNI